jgi:hypothetical protein
LHHTAKCIASNVNDNNIPEEISEKLKEEIQFIKPKIQQPKTPRKPENKVPTFLERYRFITAV